MNEGFGLVILESLAAGTPVIGTPVGGMPDVVADGRSGYIVDGDPAAMAARVDGLLDDPDRLAEMSNAARTAVEHRTWDDVAERVEAVYDSVLSDK